MGPALAAGRTVPPSLFGMGFYCVHACLGQQPEPNNLQGATGQLRTDPSSLRDWHLKPFERSAAAIEFSLWG